MRRPASLARFRWLAVDNYSDFRQVGVSKTLTP